MVVGVAVIELHLPHARSLKDKRRVVKSLIERLHARHRISVAETGFQDLHQRAEIGVAAVTRTAAEAEALLERVRRAADDESEAEILDWRPQILEEAG
jgi:uncharacterized protein YlxP (DUF503 family)